MIKLNFSLDTWLIPYQNNAIRIPGINHPLHILVLVTSKVFISLYKVFIRLGSVRLSIMVSSLRDVIIVLSMIGITS